jgi:hypothetical protein
MLLLRGWFLVSETSNAQSSRVWNSLFLGAFANSRKTPTASSSFLSLINCLSVHLSACIREAVTGGMPENFDIGEFYRNQSRNSKFLQNRTKIPGNSHVGQSAFYFVPRQKIRHNNTFVRNSVALYCSQKHLTK